MSETMLNTLAQDYLDLTLSKSRYDEIDIQWFTESPFWRRTSMRYSREYKILPDYEIGDLKHGKALRDILDESENLIGLLKAYRATAQEQELARIDYIIEHVTSVHVRAQLLSGQTMSYDEMTDGLYGLVAPEYCPICSRRCPAAAAYKRRSPHFAAASPCPQNIFCRYSPEQHSFSMMKRYGICT